MTAFPEPEDAALTARTAAGSWTRRAFLVGGGLGLLAVAGGGAFVTRGGAASRAAAAVTMQRRLAASDGFLSLPGRAEPLYMFGFVEIPLNATISQAVSLAKGKVKVPAPLLAVDQETDFTLNLTNVGLERRPDLDDSHTVHWHGFRNAISLFDGVPEVSVAVPPNRTFPYFYRPHDPGTYMYHCHFEDVEHVQLGMTGIVFVRPSQNGTSLGGFTKFAYNDGDGSTGFDREFALLLNEIDPRPHDNLLALQEFVWTDYKPSYWIINGRAYPDTIKPNGDPSLPSQPLSSLIQVNGGDRALLRFASLGYEQHAMQLPGISMTVVGEDATLLRGPGGADLSYSTGTVYIGPGESRDVLFTAPAFVGPGETDTTVLPGQAFNRYLLGNRRYATQTNGGAPGLGGMVTEVRVYQNPLPPQTTPNQTYV